MKTTLLTLAAFLIIIVGANAQESHIGVKGGVNFSNLGKDIEDSDSFDEANLKTGFHAGLFANLKIIDFFALQPEVLYSLQGSKVDVPGSSEELKFNLSYINVPVLAKVYLGENFNIHAGPYIGFLVNTSVEFNDNTVEDALEDFYKTLDFGVAGGIEFESGSGFVLGARYNAGLADIRDDDNQTIDFIDDDDDFDVRNQVVQAYIGLMF